MLRKQRVSQEAHMLLRINDSPYSLEMTADKREGALQDILLHGVPCHSPKPELVEAMAKQILSLEGQQETLLAKLAAAMNGAPIMHVQPFSYTELQNLKDGEEVYVPETAFYYADFGKINLAKQCVEADGGAVLPFDTYGAEWLAYKN
jgi:hypothetical protein